jgi:hypothetical protein
MLPILGAVIMVVGSGPFIHWYLYRSFKEPNGDRGKRHVQDLMLLGILERALLVISFLVVWQTPAAFVALLVGWPSLKMVGDKGDKWTLSMLGNVMSVTAALIAAGILVFAAR